MIQDQDLQAWPASTAGSSTTLTVYFQGRQTQGVGAFSSTNMPATLVILFPLGRTDMLTMSSIRETIVTYLMNSNALVAWWSPENMTLEAAFRQAIASLSPTSKTASATAYVWFDGQFGPVLVS